MLSIFIKTDMSLQPILMTFNIKFHQNLPSGWVETYGHSFPYMIQFMHVMQIHIIMRVSPARDLWDNAQG
jgi:hypothetical protein